MPEATALSAEDLQNYKRRREIFEEQDLKTVRGRYPQLTPDQLSELNRRVAARVHALAVHRKVPDDVMFAELRRVQSLDTGIYWGEAKLMLEETTAAH